MNERKPFGPKSMENAAAGFKKQSAKLSREVQSKLGQQLRAAYDDVINEGVPDRFASLINRLDDGGNKDKH